MSVRSATRILPALLGCCAAALAGCGLGAGKAPRGTVRLSVTRDFGTRALVDLDKPKVVGADTVMRVLARNARIRTRYGGGFVQAIDGVAGGRRGGRPVDWFYYVNGIDLERGAAAVGVHAGDRIWWDRHDWGQTPQIPAVVGSFPEPFVHGSRGRRLPVRVECVDPRASACRTVSDKLVALGVPAGRSDISTSAADTSLRVLVGPWKALRGREVEADRLDAGPKASGVYARFDAAAARLVVLDERGRPARTLGAGSGLVAATRAADRQPVWFVTGTDDAGVTAASRAFDESALADHFALAISAADLAVGVPLIGGGGR